MSKWSRAGRDEDGDSVDDDAWNGLLSDTGSDVSSEGRKSKDLDRETRV
jgi:hypothetical protein